MSAACELPRSKSRFGGLVLPFRSCGYAADTIARPANFDPWSSRLQVC